MTQHRYPVSLTLLYTRSGVTDALEGSPVTITDHLDTPGETPVYMVENQESGESFFAEEQHLWARPADYAQLARVYQLAAQGLAHEANRLNAVGDLMGQVRNLTEATVCYRLGAEMLQQFTRMLHERIN